jgi:NitT/TauT family transport system substrate-binding protein
MIVDESPMSIISMKTANIERPVDVVGKQLADPVGESSRVMFPAFAKANSFDPNSVTWLNVTATLREHFLAQHRADAILGQWYSITKGLHQIGVKDDDIRIMKYADWGLNVFGGSVATKPAWLAAHPDAAKAFVRCTVEGIKAAMADPSSAMAAIEKRNSMVDEPIEKVTLSRALEVAAHTPNVRQNGLSYVTHERLERVLRQATEALGIPMPNPDEVWTDKYLPPRAELMVN